MSLAPSFQTDPLSVELRPAPLSPASILEGTPIARNAVLYRSDDSYASTMLWECSVGKFEWYYEFEETIHILAGRVVIEADGAPARQVGTGDIVNFRQGSRARWDIQSPVRKLAFCHYNQSWLIGFGARLMRRVRRSLQTPLRISSLVSRTAT